MQRHVPPNPPPRLTLLCALSLSACGAGDTAPGAGAGQSSGTFAEVAAARGIDFVHVYGDKQRFWFPELASGALGLLDYDGDGDLDLYCVQAGDCKDDQGDQHANVLFRNDGATFTDVTAQAGVGDTGYGHGLAAGDYDNDGDTDLYVANLRANVLYRNNGDGTFSDVTLAAGVGVQKWTVSCGFFDYDADGDLDLFLVNNVNWSPAVETECETNYGARDYCSPGNYNAPSVDTLLRNEGDGTFRDVTESSGIAKAAGVGWGLAAADYDGDGSLDFYVANDGMANFLWLNDGDGHFEDRALISGCALSRNGTAEAGMGVQAIDVENDGDMDLFMTHMHNETNTFYSNKQGLFADRTSTTGLGAASMLYTGFGMGFHDFDLDGELDLFVANGRVGLTPPHLSPADPYAEPNQLFFGAGHGKFHEDPEGPTGQRLLGTTRAAAFGDIDNDGDVDIVYQDWAAPLRLLVNRTEGPGQWIGLRLLGRSGSDAIGAKVKVVHGGRSQYRRCDPCYSFCAANDPRLHFGLGQASRVDEVHVTWPGGKTESFGPLQAGQYHSLAIGTGR